MQPAPRPPSAPALSVVTGENPARRALLALLDALDLVNEAHRDNPAVRVVLVYADGSRSVVPADPLAPATDIQQDAPASPPVQRPSLDAYSESTLAAYEAAPPADQRPISMRALARRAGYSYATTRESTRRLIDAGWLARITGGIRRAR